MVEYPMHSATVPAVTSPTWLRSSSSGTTTTLSGDVAKNNLAEMRGVEVK